MTQIEREGTIAPVLSVPALPLSQHFAPPAFHYHAGMPSMVAGQGRSERPVPISTAKRDSLL
jgi:hypothetical protein